MYYKSITTNDKIYNKVLVKGHSPQLNFKKVIAELESSTSSDSELSEEESQ